MFKGCEILIEGVVLKANLIPLEMSDFDVILGMDWLSNHRASTASPRRSYLRNRDTQCKHYFSSEDILSRVVFIRPQAH